VKFLNHLSQLSGMLLCGWKPIQGCATTEVHAAKSGSEVAAHRRVVTHLGHGGTTPVHLLQFSGVILDQVLD
jgi:hypothetical protein